MLPDVRTLAETVAGRVIAAADELTDLDSAIGDGDHGLNMKRGFAAVLEDLPAVAEKPLPEALQSIGMKLLMKVGGASGPLYGTLIMTLGKELPAEPSAAEAARAFTAAVLALKTRGKADIGQKTMLDVLEPVAGALAAGELRLPVIRSMARECATATIAMRAGRGRASFLGERSIGHMDPGARSAQLMIEAVCDALEART
ncbi:MAG: dihydroxyacetone kinase subunit DhaL [Pseudomonadota bacterium]|nr:dihydroxyacetone kinase subunit DhaL [Pseudomonadota bacterium]